MRYSDQIRKYVKEAIIDAARWRGEETVKVVAGDVHRALRFHNRVPLVCNALRSPALLRDCGIRILKIDGPPSGQSTTVTVTYEILPANGHSDAPSKEKEPHPLWALFGAGKETFAQLGGGENFIRRMREDFFGEKEHAD